MRLPRALRQTLTIARRDFTATVFTPIFLLFLFAPVIMGSFGAIGGMGAASAGSGADAKTRLVALVPAPAGQAMAAADRRLRAVVGGDDRPPRLETRVPGVDPAAAARRLMAAGALDTEAVLYGPIAHPTILIASGSERSADYLTFLAGEALTAERLGRPRPAVVAQRIGVAPRQGSASGTHRSAFFAVFGIFFLTLFLAGQVVGTMAEERNNKVIEVLAAAVPLEAVFMGKLVGMFGVALLFVGFWGTVLSVLAAHLPAGMAAELAGMAPAVGDLPFALLFAAYFTMAYLLLGAVFLAVGAQASTMREIQMLSLPITVLQVAMFALSSAAVSHPGSTVAQVAELFPLSSPFAMAGHAAAAPELWPHAAALAWQALWVALFVTLGARAFRRGVLKSGAPRRRPSPAGIQPDPGR